MSYDELCEYMVSNSVKIEAKKSAIREEIVDFLMHLFPEIDNTYIDPSYEEEYEYIAFDGHDWCLYWSAADTDKIICADDLYELLSYPREEILDSDLMEVI